MAKRLPFQSPPLQSLLPASPRLNVLILYALGQLGWSLASFAVGNLLVYFYMPPEQGAPVFPSFVFQGAVLSVLTLIGLVSAGGRVLDGIVDPIIANWSDRNALQGVFEGMGQTPVRAFQHSVALLHGIALIFMLLPAIFLNEQRYARQAPSDHSLRQALSAVFGNRNFRWFLASFLLYWLALTFIQLGVGFYTTLLLGLDKSMAFTFSLVSFLTSFLLYFPMNLLVRRWGKRRTMLTAYLMFGGIFLVVAFVKAIPLPKEWLLYGLAVAAAAPLATFGIFPTPLSVTRLHGKSGRAESNWPACFLA